MRRHDDWFGVTGKALNWLRLYPLGSCQRIKLGDCLSSKADLTFEVPQGSVLGLCLSLSIPQYLVAWSLDMLSLTISMLMTASCMFPLRQGTRQQHWMVYSHVWPQSSHGCRQINWNWSQMKLNSSLSRTNDSGANSSLCFLLSSSVSIVTQQNLCGILEYYLTELSPSAHIYQPCIAHAFTICGICGVFAATLIWIVQKYL